MHTLRRLSVAGLLLALLIMPLAVEGSVNVSPPEVGPLALQPAPQGRIVYTANASDTNEDGVIDEADNDIMFGIDIGSDPADGRFHIAGGPPASAAYPRLSQDGEIVLCHAFVDTNEDGVTEHSTDMPFLAVLNVDGTDVTPLTEPGSAVALEAEWSPDERTSVFAYADEDTNGDGALTVDDTRHLALLELGELDPNEPSPTQLVSETPPTILTDGTISVYHPVFWTDTQILFEGVSVEDGREGIYLYDLATDELTELGPQGLNSRRPAPSPDGTQLAAQVESGDGYAIWVSDIESGAWTQLTDGTTNSLDPTWSPDSSQLAMASNTEEGGMVMVYADGETQILAETEAQVSLTSFSPNGDAVAYASIPDNSQNVALNVVSLDGGYAATLTPEDTSLVEFVWAAVPDSDGQETTSVLPDGDSILRWSEPVALLETRV